MNFKELFDLILDRKRTLPEGSGTTLLLTKGFEKILPKFNEEAFEVGLALESEGPDEVALEVSQCFYYLVCIAVYLNEGFDSLNLSPDADLEFDSEHDLAKQCARKASMVCHEPNITRINEMTPLLFAALKMKGSSLDKMFSYL